MSMKISDLPMNKPERVGGDGNTSIMLTRIDDDKALAQYVCVATGDEVARMHLWDNGGAEIVSFDSTYWNCIVNGTPASKNDLEDILGRTLRSMQIDTKNRVINITL